MRVVVVTTLLLGTHLALSSASYAQHIFLPPTRGATALSIYIDAQARYTAAAGDYLESAARARLFHAEARLKETHAYSSEMDNRQKWINFYFEGKLMWKKFQRKLHPNFMERQKESAAVKIDSLTTNPAILMKKDLIGMMNWLLVQLATHPQGKKFLFEEAVRDALKDVDIPLSEQDLAGLRLCLNERLDGHQIDFRANQGSSLMSAYPLVLLEEGFQKLRDELDTFKEQVARDCRDGSIELETLNTAERICNQFRQKLDSEYPKNQRKVDSRQYFEHKTGVDFLEAQEAAIRLAVESNNVSGLNGDYAFHGDRLLQLLNHMARLGMEFDKAPQGTKHIYEKVFMGMRNILMSLETDQDAAMLSQRSITHA